MRAERYLLPEERRVVSVRRHPAMLAGRGASAFFAMLAAAFIHDHLPPGSHLATLAWIGAFVVIGRFLWRALQWSLERFVVTDQRVMLITGVATRKVAMMPLRKVTDMTYQRSLAGRLGGFGEFVMESAGESQGLRRVDFLPNPDGIYLAVSDLLFGENSVIDPPAWET